MAEIWFYQLERTGLEETLPPLLEKVMEKGWRAVVRASSPQRLDALDGRLWSYRQEGFLAHGKAGHDHDADQPILLTMGNDNPNGAQALIICDNAGFEELTTGNDVAFERTMILFSGADDEALKRAREWWKMAKDAGHTIAYWEQGKQGGWEKRA